MSVHACCIGVVTVARNDIFLTLPRFLTQQKRKKRKKKQGRQKKPVRFYLGRDSVERVRRQMMIANAGAEKNRKTLVTRGERRSNGSSQVKTVGRRRRARQSTSTGANPSGLLNRWDGNIPKRVFVRATRKRHNPSRRKDHEKTARDLAQGPGFGRAGTAAADRYGRRPVAPAPAVIDV